MLQHERLKEILRLLHENGRLDINELSELFSVSKVTIRKDLDILQEQGSLVRYYGGAAPVSEALPDAREKKEVEPLKKSDTNKNKIAQMAASHVKDGDTIFLGSGVTCSLMADYFGDLKDLTVITNNISAIPKLLNTVDRLVIIGGEVITLNKINYFSWTENPDQYLENIFVHKVFTSCTGIDIQAGLTVNAVVSTFIFKCLPSIKREWFLLVDETKFDNIGIYKFNALDAIDHIISDIIPKKYLDYFEELKIETESYN